MSDAQNGITKYAEQLIEDSKEFFEDSKKFIKRCNKPDKKEYTKIAQSCALGFLVMGAIGYFIKLFFIPINNIILS